MVHQSVESLLMQGNMLQNAKQELLEHFQTAVAVVQNALFPEGIMYRKDIGFFAPPDNEVSAIVFRTLISIASEPNWEEIKSGRGEWI